MTVPHLLPDRHGGPGAIATNGIESPGLGEVPPFFFRVMLRHITNPYKLHNSTYYFGGEMPRDTTSDIV